MCRTLRKRQIRCRRFSRPFTRPTIRVHVLRLRGRQRRVQRGSRGRQWPWRSYSHVEVFSRESVCRVVLRRLMAGAQGCMSCVYAPHVV